MTTTRYVISYDGPHGRCGEGYRDYDTAVFHFRQCQRQCRPNLRLERETLTTEDITAATEPQE